jgi:hypothetical protein
VNISTPFLWRRQEVKNRPVMPYIEGTRRKTSLRHISLEPLDRSCKVTETLLRHVESGLGNIKNRNLLVSTLDQVINQRGRTTANVDYRG